MAKCSSCQQQITWCKTEAGKSIPIDPRPVDIGGNVWIEGNVAHVLKRGETHRGPLYLAHFATCPTRINKIVDPLAAIRRVRDEVREERGAPPKTETVEEADEAHGADADADAAEGRAGGRREDPGEGKGA